MIYRERLFNTRLVKQEEKLRVMEDAASRDIDDEVQTGNTQIAEYNVGDRDG